MGGLRVVWWHKAGRGEEFAGEASRVSDDCESFLVLFSKKNALSFFTAGGAGFEVAGLSKVGREGDLGLGWWRESPPCGGWLMPEYRRYRVAGGCYFFTVNLHERGSSLLLGKIAALRQAVLNVQTRRPFHIDAWVVLRDHMHCLWTLPQGDDDFPVRWQTIKAAFSVAVSARRYTGPSLLRRREAGIWQRRYWEHTIRDEKDYANHMDYIHFNPVKHGLVARPGEWAFSTFARCAAEGVYPADWGGDGGEVAVAGER